MKRKRPGILIPYNITADYTHKDVSHVQPIL